METPDPGDHILLWTDDSPSSHALLRAFVRGGLGRGDLVAVVWPKAEQDDLRRRLEAAGVSLDLEIASDRLLLVDAEDYAPKDPDDSAGVNALWDGLEALVADRRKSGLTYLGRLAGSLFERGEPAKAERVERAVQVRQGSARVLCPYRSRDLTLEAMAGASRVFRPHTHTITALGRGRYLVERLGH